MIDILALYVLKKYDCSIYRISKIIESYFYAFFKPSFGSLNPALKRLENMGCVEAEKSITEGGKTVLRVSITSFGEKYLKNLMQTYEFKNPSSFINDARILISCSSILDPDELKMFYGNLYLQTKAYMAQINKGLNDVYAPLEDIQKNMVEKALKDAKEIEEICEKAQ